ncbi:MAG: pentapeptide MXKDX repeat protein [Devosia sp.]|uniref:pentapeptide MXKDX repeat protein n=1 Tax=Devosia sp. TaxID=1871048 RepID=UPI0024CBCDDE|nr:pentapeptide MXKDX repeat protein [Devosia sp.]UYO01098.1 MAG: pentapeptide MXKDX repeat protein [Devosia sp.]
MSKIFVLSAATALALAFATGVQAQDAMATDAMGGDAMETDSMATDSMAMDAMAPMMSDDELTLCLEQAAAITFPAVAEVAAQACHDVHNGHDAMGGDAMGGDAMGGDAMGGDAMGGDAMAPKQ